MKPDSASTVICGAGMAGLAAAYFLSVRHGMRDVVVVDELPPLSLTSDKSTECYRNWFPGPGDAMVAYMNRSIDLLEELERESSGRLVLNRRGYLFATARAEGIDELRDWSAEPCGLGAGELRLHEPGASGAGYVAAPATGYEGLPDGADLITDPALIRRHFPYLHPDTRAVLHTRRCGWLSAQQLGMYLLEQAREHGARLVRGRIGAVDVEAGRVRGVHIESEEGATRVATDRFVNAAGPYVGRVSEMLGVELPIFHECHVKVSFHDRLGAFPQSAPMTISIDPVTLPWSDDEREILAESDDTRMLLEPMPAGVHGRPAGGDSVMALWTYDDRPVTPSYPVTWDDHYPEIVIRGLATMIPAMGAYADALPQHFVDGGFYAKTQENRPLVGPLPIEGAYVMSAFSGYGIMASCAGGELLAAHVVDSPLPDYAPAFRLDRYADPAYQKLLEGWTDSGQL